MYIASFWNFHFILVLACFYYLHCGYWRLTTEFLSWLSISDSDYQLTLGKPTGPSHTLPAPTLRFLRQKRQLVADIITEEGRGTKLRMTTRASVCRWIAGHGLQPSKEWRGIIKYQSCWRLSIRNYRGGFRGPAARPRRRPADTGVKTSLLHKHTIVQNCTGNTRQVPVVAEED